MRGSNKKKQTRAYVKPPILLNKIGYIPTSGIRYKNQYAQRKNEEKRIE